MSDRTKNKFDELNLSQDELKRLNEAMKKEEFRKLLVEYAEEISDPKNRELYEREISQLEKERGMNVKFINPEPGYCIKTTENGAKKCFINICKNSNVDKPTSSVEKRKGLNDGTNSKSGLFWQIPHSCSPPREDLDKSGKEKCSIYDVVFHPDAYRMGETNQRFNTLLKETAIDSIEKNFGVKLDKVNLKVLKHLNYKGRPTATVIRRPDPDANIPIQNDSLNSEKTNENNQTDPVESLVDQLKKQYYEDQLKKTVPSNKTDEKENQPNVIKVEKNNEFTVPNYKLIHRGETDMQDYANQLDSSNGTRLVNSTRPKELEVKIELPLCKSSEFLSLDIFEKQLVLKSNNPNYFLDIKLPYPIDEKESKAKFDKSKKCLNVTLPVLPFIEKINVINIEEISSVENEQNSVINSSKDSDDLKSLSNSVKKNSSNHKYTIPNQIEISEFKNSFSINFKIPMYNNESIKFKIENDYSVSLKCTSTSSGCYTTYYSAYIVFLVENENTFNFCSCIDKMDSKLFDISEDIFEVQLEKSVKNDLNIKAYVSTNIIENLNDIDLKNKELISIKKELDKEGSSKDKIDSGSKNRSKNLNDLSKKEFIFNFQNVINKSNCSKEDEQSEDDDDDNDDGEEDVSLELDVSGKNVEKVSNIDTSPQNQQFKTIQSINHDIEEKIEEECEELDDYDTEKNYFSKSFNYNYNNNSNNKDIRMSDDNLMNNNLSSANEDSLASSLNGSISGKLKSILKKPRSFSESESNHNDLNKNNYGSRMSIGGNDSSCGSDENSDLNGSKKSVSFSNQVVRNVFKPGSTVNGMKKPHTNKNKKKNKRKRTNSDPSHDNNSCDLKEAASQFLLRSRSISESSDDNSAFLNSSNDNIEDKSIDINGNVLNKADVNKEIENKKKSTSKKKNKKKEKVNKNNGNCNNNKQQTQQSHFSMETMLEWKNQEKLSDNLELNAKNSKLPNSLDFKNKILNDLDD